MSDQLDRIGTWFVPDGDTATIIVKSDWLAYRNGQLWMLVEIEEAETDETMLLNQYSAEDLYLALRQHSPDPGQKVRVSRDGSYFRVEWDPDAADSAAEAM